MTETAVAPDRELQVLTTSRLKAHRRCKRLDFFTYEQGYRPVATNDNLKLGTLVHHGLEAWWRFKAITDAALRKAPSALQAALDAMRAHVADVEGGETSAYAVATAEAMLITYHFRWNEERLEVLGVEAEFEGPLVNPDTGANSRTFIRRGKIDAIVRDEAGRVHVVEHKTTSEDATPGSDYCRRLLLDSQVSDYFVGCRLLGFEPQGCIYDVLGKPTIRPHKATPPEKRKYKKDTGELYANQRASDETPAEFFDRVLAWYAENADRALQRIPVVRLEEDENDAALDFHQTARDIREAQLRKRWPRNPEACVRFGETCAFFDVCTRTATLNDPARFRRAAAQHEELSA